MGLPPKQGNEEMRAEGFRFAIVASRWNDFVTSKLIDGAHSALSDAGADDSDIEIFMVPGAFELPPTAQKIAETGRFDAIIALGAVIRGETPHFDYIAAETARGIAQVSLQTRLPVLFGVITADTREQALDRAGGKIGNKGSEAAISAVEMVNLYRSIEAGEKSAKDEQKALPHVV